MAECNHIPDNWRRKIGKMLNSGNLADIQKAIDFLTRECGLCRQNFFTDWLPISEIQKGTHAKLEQDLWAHTLSASINGAFDAKKWDICDFITKLSWDILLQWRQNVPQNVRDMSINGNPDKRSNLHPSQLLIMQELDRDLLECLIELKNTHHDWYDVVILWVFMVDNYMTRKQVAEALSIPKGTVQYQKDEGMKFYSAVLLGRGKRIYHRNFKIFTSKEL